MKQKRRTKVHSRIVLGILLPVIIVAGMFALITSKEAPKKEKIEASEVVTAGNFRLTADNRWDGTDNRSYAELNWDDVSDLSSEGYRLYQSEDGTNWDMRSTRYGDAIEVLNIYPDIYQNNIRDWMSDPTVGLGLINVTPVSLSDFNTNPNSYLRNAQGEYQYDVIFVGTANANNNVSFNKTAIDRLIEFIEAGRGLLVGHDVLSGNTRGWNGVTCDLTENNRLAPYLGIGLRNLHVLNEGYPASGKVTVTNNGYLMKYPHELENDQELTIPITHSFGQVAGSAHNGTIWLEFKDYSILSGTTTHIQPDSTTNFYLVTNGNAGMIQTGHSGGTSTIDERRIIANTLYNLAQVTLESKANDYTVSDNVKPEKPDFIIRCGDEGNINLRVDAKDKGKEYQWYIEANTKSSGVKTSDRVKETITSNIAGYFYEVSDSPTSTLATQVEAKKDAFGRIDSSEYDLYVAPDDNSVNYETASSFTLSEKNTSGKYVHILAVDRANNVGEVTSKQIRGITQPIDFEIERTGNEAKLVELAVDSSMDNKMKSIEVQIPKNTEIKDFASLSLPTDWYSFENSETADYYSFSFAMETNNSAATIQTFLEDLRFTINNPVNNSGSIKIILHERIYTSWIDEDGKAHYYVFMPEMSAPGKNWFQAYDSAKKLSYKGLTGYLATITSEEEHDFIFDNIAKEPGWLGGTRGVLKDGSKINDETSIPQIESDYDISKDDWYWADGPESGEVFFVGKDRAGGGYAPANAYDGFDKPVEPNNLWSDLTAEYALQFALSNSKYWNDLPGKLPYEVDYNRGYYVEFSEYGGQTEGEEITDVCWKAAIPQKISMKAYDEQGAALTDGDILYDQQLRLEQTITVQPKSLEFYTFIEAQETDGTSRGVNYTVTKTYQEGRLIYSLRKAILHVRQVIHDPLDELVVPSEGYVTIENNLYNSGSPALDANYQADMTVPSGKQTDNPNFSNWAINTNHLASVQDEILLSVIVQEFYEYEGHYLTDETSDPNGASHATNVSKIAGDISLARGTVDTQQEFWLTLYLKPNGTNQGKPQPYSWDYSHNDLGKIKTK